MLGMSAQVQKMRSRIQYLENLKSAAIARAAGGHTKIDADGTIINLVRHIVICA